MHPAEEPGMLELAIVVPTFNERDNILPLLGCLDRVLKDIRFEVIFVDDDSPDGTAALIRKISLQRPEIRVLQRLHRRGLASACVEGMMATAAPYIAVMDADLQHDESILPELLRTIREKGVDVVVASRNVAGGSMGEFTKQRVAVSDLGRSLSRMICRCEITDPMSGFFILDRRFVEEVAPHISAIGFKVLVDLISSSQRPVKLAEVPYRFRERLHGESKLDTLVLVEYLLLVGDKLIGYWIPPRFVLFSMVGLAGAALYMALLFLLYRTAQFDFRFSLLMATMAAMTLNFLLNNVITYRDRRLKGGALLAGLLTFYLACSVGAVVAIRISELTQQAGLHWFLAGAVGVLIASVWNFTITQFFTWRLGHRSRIARRSPVRTN
jgi:dolichol-phosphate mannosyltransferase